MWFFCCFFFPDPTVTTRHLHQIFHIMVFVLVHSMRLFLVKRQLHKMMLRTMRRLGGIFFFSSRSSQQSCSFLTVHNNSVFIVRLKVKCDIGFNFPGLEEKLRVCVCSILSFGDKRLAFCVIQPIEKRSRIRKETFCIWKCTLNGVNDIPEVREESPWRLNLAAVLKDSTPPWVAALWWLSVSLVMSLAALTQVICMQADSAWDVRQRQWCTYHFPPWLIEDCNLCRTFSLITHVSGSKTRTLSCHWALDSSRAFSFQEDWSPPLRWAQFSSHLHYCYKCRIECIW